MKRALSIAAAVFALSASTGSELAAQWDAGLPGDDVASLTLHLGALAPTTTFPREGGSFGPGIGGGVSGTYWFHDKMGFRGSFLIGKTPGEAGESSLERLPGNENPSIWLYGGDVLLRYPLTPGESMAWFPYVGAGLGGKMYRWENEWTGFNRDYTLATSFAAGIDIRPTDSPWYGFGIEARMYNSDYKWHGYRFDGDDVKQRDFLVTAGFKLNR